MHTWQTIFCLWMATIPLVFWNGMYEGTKIIWLFGGGVGLLALWIIVLRKKLFSLLSPDDMWYLAWLGILVLSSIYSVHPVSSLIGGSYRHQGVIFFFLLWVIGKTIQLLHIQHKEYLIRLIGFGVAAEAITAMVKFLVIHDNTGTMGEPHALAGYLVIGIPFLFHSLKERGINLHYASILLICITMIITRAKIGMVSLFVITCVYMLQGFVKRHARVVIAIFFLAIFLMPIAVFCISDRSGYFIASDYENRPVIWATVIGAIAGNPLLGYGAESGDTVISKIFDQKHINLENLMIDRAHNVFLDITLWSGLPGLVVYMIWLAHKAVRTINTKETWLMSALFAWLVFAGIQPLSVAHWILFMVLVSVREISNGSFA